MEAKRMRASRETLREKIIRCTKRDAALLNADKGPDVLQDLRDDVYPQLQVVNYYGGYRAPATTEYIPQSVSVRLQKDEQREYQKTVDIDEILGQLKAGQMVFIGPAGSGKTTLLKSIATKVSENRQRYLEDIEYVHFLEGKNLRRAELTPMKLLLHNIEGLSDEEVTEYLQFATTHPEKVLFIIDSLDTFPYALQEESRKIEVAEKAHPKTIIWNLLTGNLLPGVKIISSSREHTIRTYQGALRANKVIALTGFSKESIRQVAKGFLGEEAESIMYYLETKHPSLLDLCSIPVFLNYTLIGYKLKSTFIPKTMTGVLSVVLQGLLRSPHAHEKNIFEAIHKLKKLAFTGTQERRVLFSLDELARYNLRQEEVVDLTISVPGGTRTERLVELESSVFFNHQSLQEQLTAYYIAEMDINNFEKFLEQNIHQPYYSVVRRLLCGIILDGEVGSISREIFKREPSEQHRKLLEQSMERELKRCREIDTLELLLSFSEAGSGLDDIVSTSVTMVDIRRVPISPGEMFAVGSLIGRCSHLDVLCMAFCNLNPNLLNILNSCLKDSKVKIDVLDVTANEEMTSEGLSTLAEIVTRCEIRDISFQWCSLKPHEVQAFNNVLKQFKMEKLKFSYCNKMGVQGLSAIGDLVKRCNVEILQLQRCGIKEDEIRAFRQSMGDAMVKTVELDERDTYQQEGYALPVAEICQLLANISTKLDLTNCILKAEEREMLQRKLDELYPTKLKIQIGQKGSLGILESGNAYKDKFQVPGSSVQPVGDGSNSDAWFEKQVQSRDGGILKLHGSSIYIPPKALEKDASVKIFFGIDSTVPNDYLPITPRLGFAPGTAKITAGAQIKVTLPTWCYVDRPDALHPATAEVDLLYKESEKEDWRRERTVTLGKQNALCFETEKLGNFVFGVRRVNFPRTSIHYPLHIHVFHNMLGGFRMFVSISDEKSITDFEQRCMREGFRRAVKDRVETKIWNSHSFALSCISSPEKCAVVTNERSEFFFNGDLRHKGFIQVEFHLDPVPVIEEGKKLIFNFKLHICYHLEKDISFSVAWEPEYAARTGIPSILPADGDRKATEFVRKLRSDIEENIRTSRKIRVECQLNGIYLTRSDRINGCNIGIDGGTLELCGCTLEFPPHALHETTPVEVEVSYGGTFSESYVAVTPTLRCTLFGACLKQPVKMVLPVFCCIEGASSPTVLTKKKQSDWSEIASDPIFDRENSKIEFEVTHFCHHVGVYIGRLISRVFGRRVYKLVNKLFYRKDTMTFIVLTHVDDEKVKQDCQESLKKLPCLEILELPYKFVAKAGDCFAFGLVDCSVSPEPPETLIEDLGNFSETKYDMSHLRLPRYPETGDGMFYFKYVIRKNGKPVKEFFPTINLRDTAEHPNRRSPERHAVVADATSEVEQMTVRLATRNFYESHLNCQTIYQFPRNRNKGRALIINNSFRNDTVQYREGSLIDLRNMKSLWENLGLQVVAREDLLANVLEDEVRNFAQTARGVSLCVLIVMSHGSIENGNEVIMCENNGSVLVEDLLHEFTDARSPHLIGIPKLIFLQCCRGGRTLRRPTDVADVMPERNPRIAVDAASDRLVVHATQSSYVAFLNTRDGSWFINAISNVFMQNAHDKNVQDMVTLASQAVSQREALSEVDGRGRPGQQIPEHRGCLLKTLYLFPGWPEPM